MIFFIMNLFLSSISVTFLPCVRQAQKNQRTVALLRLFTTHFHDSYATAEDVICASKNSFSRESLLAGDDLIRKIMKAGNMNGSNENNASDRSDSGRSKVSHVGDALQVLFD